MWFFTIAHQQVGPTEGVVSENRLGLGHCSRTKGWWQDIVKRQAIPFLFLRVDQLCQGKKLLLVILIPCQIDVAKACFAKEALDDIMSVEHRANRENSSYLLHAVPPCHFSMQSSNNVLLVIARIIESGQCLSKSKVRSQEDCAYLTHFAIISSTVWGNYFLRYGFFLAHSSV